MVTTRTTRLVLQLPAGIHCFEPGPGVRYRRVTDHHHERRYSQRLGLAVPFLFGIVLALIGAWLRRNIDETPAYRAATQDTAQPTERGFLLALRAFGFTIHWTVAFYILLSYMPTFTRLHAGVSDPRPCGRTRSACLC